MLRIIEPSGTNSAPDHRKRSFLPSAFARFPFDSISRFVKIRYGRSPRGEEDRKCDDRSVLILNPAAVPRAGVRR